MRLSGSISIQATVLHRPRVREKLGGSLFINVPVVALQDFLAGTTPINPTNEIKAFLVAIGLER